MTIKELQSKAYTIWGGRKLKLGQMIIVLGKVFGDICRFERQAPKDRAVLTDSELKKELGNLIFSTVRFCDDLGYDPEDCIQQAITAQEKYARENAR